MTYSNKISPSHLFFYKRQGETFLIYTHGYLYSTLYFGRTYSVCGTERMADSHT